MNSHKKHREPTLEGVVRASWCELCYGWHCKRQWLQSSTGQPYAPWIAHTDEVFIPCDEWSDRNMMKWAMGAANTAKLLERSAALGQEPLGA